MTRAEELAKIAARLAEIAKEMEPQPTLSRVCAIGETKEINGLLYRKRPVNNEGCVECAFFTVNCPGDSNKGGIEAIEDGGSECYGTIWVIA